MSPETQQVLPTTIEAAPVAVETLDVDRAFKEIVAGLEATVPAEVRRELTQERAGKDPGGQDWQCLG